jgi:signal transduction histidine kinase
MNELLQCTDTAADLFGIFTFSVAPELLLYSYIPISALTLILSLIVAFKDNFSKRSRLLLLVSALFSTFLINEIILWTATPAGLIYASWSLSMMLRAGIYLSLLLFIYVFTHRSYPPFGAMVLGTLLALPLVLFLPTALNVVAVDIVDCVGVNGPLWYYLYALEFLCVLVLGVLTLRTFIASWKNKNSDATGSRYLLGGSFLLLLFVFLSELAGEFTGIYEVNLFGPIGMLGFVATLSYLIVRFQAFNMKLIASQALILSIFALNASEFFYIVEFENLIISIVTLILISVAGYFLIRSVKREVKQREEIQDLATRLAKSNERLKQLDTLKSEFVSIASHQLRSPLAAMMGYASMLRDGSYGKLSAKAQEAAVRIEESTRLMAQSVEDYLNVSRIEAGHMKYTLTDFSLRDQAEHITDDIRPLGLQNGVVMLFKTNLNGNGVVHADKGKTEQIIHNLINNSLKYTPKGTITVVVRDDVTAKKAFLDILDTGIGMSDATLHSIFTKFERGKNANSTNIHGTGLGLFTALKLAEAMNGTITARSDGEGKGSCFTLELPLVN